MDHGVLVLVTVRATGSERVQHLKMHDFDFDFGFDRGGGMYVVTGNWLGRRWTGHESWRYQKIQNITDDGRPVPPRESEKNKQFTCKI
jgi:hypothetical protein